MSKKVCVLDRLRAELYEGKGIFPADCEEKLHSHVTWTEADALVGANDGMATARRLTPQRDPVTGFFDRKERIVLLPLVHLQPKEGVVCLVRGVIQGHVTGARKPFASTCGKGMKYRIPAVGARDRQTSARKINYVPPSGEAEQVTQ
jgi:hypothetical protein